MRKLILLSICIVLVITANNTLFAQETNTQYSGGIIAGTEQRFLISFSNQTTIKAKILSVDGNNIVIKKNGEDYRTIDRSDIVKIEAIPYGKIGSVGFGYGIPFGGVLGFNGELNILPILSVNAAIGTTIFAGFGYDFGIKAYFRKQGPRWRPRASVFYGTNAIWIEDFGDPNNQNYSGITVGLGQLLQWQRHGLDLDLMYIVTSELYNAHPDDFFPIKVSAGYRIAF